MRLVLLESRDTIIEKNNGTMNFWKSMERRKNRIWYEKN